MFKIMVVFFIGTCLYFAWDGIKDIRRKSKVEEDLTEAKTESEILDIEEQAVKLERENQDRKEALYGKEEETTEA